MHAEGSFHLFWKKGKFSFSFFQLSRAGAAGGYKSRVARRELWKGRGYLYDPRVCKACVQSLKFCNKPLWSRSAILPVPWAVPKSISSWSAPSLLDQPLSWLVTVIPTFSLFIPGAYIPKQYSFAVSELNINDFLWKLLLPICKLFFWYVTFPSLFWERASERASL